MAETSLLLSWDGQMYEKTSSGFFQPDGLQFCCIKAASNQQKKNHTEDW